MRYGFRNSKKKKRKENHILNQKPVNKIINGEYKINKNKKKKYWNRESKTKNHILDWNSEKTNEILKVKHRHGKSKKQDRNGKENDMMNIFSN